MDKFIGFDVDGKLMAEPVVTVTCEAAGLPCREAA